MDGRDLNEPIYSHRRALKNPEDHERLLTNNKQFIFYEFHNYVSWSIEQL